MYLTSHFGFAAVASGNDLESDVINLVRAGRHSLWPRLSGWIVLDGRRRRK
jgi:hypothetical protein